MSGDAVVGGREHTVKDQVPHAAVTVSIGVNHGNWLHLYTAPSQDSHDQEDQQVATPGADSYHVLSAMPLEKQRKAKDCCYQYS